MFYVDMFRMRGIATVWTVRSTDHAEQCIVSIFDMPQCIHSLYRCNVPMGGTYTNSMFHVCMEQCTGNVHEGGTFQWILFVVVSCVSWTSISVCPVPGT